jgi:alkaline phosphatase D
MRRPLVIAAAAASAAIALFGVAWHVRRLYRSRRGRAAFHGDALDVALAPGVTGPHGVRLWGRSASPGQHELVLEERESGREVTRVVFDVAGDTARDGTWALDYPDDFPAAPRLQPVTKYTFSVRGLGSEALAQGGFETSPLGAEDTPSRFAFAAMSCHLPFDEHGELSDSACRLLGQLPELLERWNVKRVLMLGDQMYGDCPANCSLFNPGYFRSLQLPGRESVLDCTREEVRRLYQERHRIFWKHGGFQQLQASFPCHMILDDHEIVDNFGTPAEHSEPAFENLRAGALDAFYDYQGARGLRPEDGARPEAFYQGFEYGTVAAFIMDLRSERRTRGEQIEVCSPAQWQALSGFLESQRDKHVIFLGLSVPLLHVPDWLATAGTALGADDGDVADRWTNPKMHASRDRLLHLIREHQKANPRQRLVLLGGDVHVGAASRFAWSDDTRDTYQLIASALSNREGFFLRGLVELIPKIGAVIGHDGTADFSGELLEPAKQHACDGDPSNPYGKLNVGVIEVERISAEESSVRLLLIGCEDDGEAKVVFDSGPL